MKALVSKANGCSPLGVRSVATNNKALSASEASFCPAQTWVFFCTGFRKLSFNSVS